MIKRTKDGKFEKTRSIWTPENWDDGYFDNNKRLRVYRPDYPRAYKNGYALRAHVVWWLHHGEPHKREYELHHIDGTTYNDHIENLVPLDRFAHGRTRERQVFLICAHCGNPFKVPNWRIRNRPTRFCSQQCYHDHPRKEGHSVAISEGLKEAYKNGKR